MPLASPHTYRNALRGILGKTVILAGLIAAIYPAQASEMSEINKLMRNGQYADALVKTDAVLAKHPRDAQLRFYKGLILAEQNKSAEAIAVFSKLTEDFPDLPEPYNNLAVLYAANGQYDKARAALDMAMRTNPTYATALENLGDVYAKLASQAYDKALQIDPANNVPAPKLTLVRTLNGNLTGGTIPKLASANTSVKATSAPADTPVTPTTPPAPPVIAQPEAKPEPKVDARTAEKAAQAAAQLAAKQAADKAAEKAAQLAAEKQAKADKAAEKAARAAEKEAKDAKLAAEKQADSARTDKDKTAVLNTVYSWAKAWSDMDVKNYLASYGNDFTPPKGQTRKQWSDERRDRIEEKGHINVKVESPQVTFKNDTATVRFRQIYNSNRLTVDSRKTLILTKQGNKWLIKQERSGG
ncbi:tetratricopeptide (TPR) repeat protein [Herbaspirillum sp. Sphag1AN]|nr:MULTISPECIES: tetratricopeptide repeat protein [unclassified Herbaspirillum]MBB3210886.1 tetratricopeptide (TPR) repeat protein [Herbaspirillum sp. Sphag1AN]MBB3244516.1 tetratricopeptide (TPR) repeat protein [Herbaspirillum sp. Sphag64]